MTETALAGSPLAEMLECPSLFSADELGLRDAVREFVDHRVRPNIADWYESARFPVELVQEFGELGLLGMHLDGYGCAGRTAVEYGIAAQELEAGDSGLRTFVSVQGSLAMTAIHRHGSEEQKVRWLPSMARGETIGCFALTEPEAGSDPGAMTTTAVESGGEWVLNGSKRWIGLATIADVAIVWAKAAVDGGRERVRGFIIPTDTPGFSARPIEPKLSMRASIQCDVELQGVRLPYDAILPENAGLAGPLACLDEARYGIVWGVVGAARDALTQAAGYAQERTPFGQPLASYQLTQRKLVDLALEVHKAQLLAINIGRLKDAGTLPKPLISAGKLNNCRTAIEVCREARTILGGNGVTLDYSPLRHANNLESVRTYEGTDEVHTLILGQHLTGHNAFRPARG
ncbi:acyl-CoA dehydrogenase family protein [Zhihengliuella halotolerans]|uniref:glutaryl-CoA dehydrogenase (ETF) n=1 Tax=Zhihengliuella halotolerans TaxID=370736 RepID=A0A4Q8AGT0_9MICC|nr:acyl-CoA dehydrogenase family protein [Zhihengliuella halotolerans]RZU62869.1 glutaryl-CoA dehydrogenase [Zhihengliuella halotolerans]